MGLFKKRESLIQNIAYMGIMASINVIAVILMNYVLPVLFVPFMLILPFTSTVVTLFCKKKYFLIYCFATLSISILVTINNITDALFYVLPSLISGFIFGIMIEYHLPSILAIFVTALINVGLTYAVLPLVNFIYGQDLINVIASIFGLGDYQYLYLIVPSFILVISLVQETLSFAIINSELPKLGIKEEEDDKDLSMQICGLSGSLLSLVFYFIFPELCLFFLIFALFFCVYQVVKSVITINKIVLIIDAISSVIFIILFALLYSKINAPFGILLFNILFDVYLVTSLINYTLTKKRKSLE